MIGYIALRQVLYAGLLAQPEPPKQKYWDNHTGGNHENQEPRTKNLKHLIAALAFGAGLCSATSAHAVLTLTLGGQGVYDDHLNLTWMRNANLAASNTFGVSGIDTAGGMTWNTAQSWVAAMNAANYLGYSDWRLPATLQPDASCGSQLGGLSYGYNCTGSEMGHLFYNELGGVAGQAIATTHNANYGLFQNIQSFGYWSGAEYSPAALNAWFFDSNFGFQGAGDKGVHMFAWAVRPGQVAAVPEPETYAMLLAGLGLLGFTARRRKRGA